MKWVRHDNTIWINGHKLTPIKDHYGFYKTKVSSIIDVKAEDRYVTLVFKNKDLRILSYKTEADAIEAAAEIRECVKAHREGNNETA